MRVGVAFARRSCRDALWWLLESRLFCFEIIIYYGLIESTAIVFFCLSWVSSVVNSSWILFRGEFSVACLGRVSADVSVDLSGCWRFPREGYIFLDFPNSFVSFNYDLAFFVMD